MFLAKKTLCGLSLPWFTCSLGSPGQTPFCSSASTSVPGAPASSLVTGSQERVLNPGSEIAAPDWVAVLLLATRQPPAPRLTRSLAPVSDGDASAATDLLIRAAGRGLAALPGPLAAASGPAAAGARPACDACAGRPDSVASATANVAADQVATRMPEARLVDRTAALLSAAPAPR